MSGFSQQDFNRFVIDNSVIGLFEKPRVLKSGRTSNWYVNWRSISNDAFLLGALSEFVVSYLRELVAAKKIDAPDCIYGVPEGATKIGVLSQFVWAKSSPGFGPGSHVVAMGRGSRKEHGAPEDRYFVGMPQGKTVVLEDVTTTGGSLLTTIDQLLEAGVNVTAAIGLTNRMEKRDDGKTVVEAVGEKLCAGKSIPYFQLSSALDLLPEMCRKVKPSDEIKRSIEAEFSEFGVEKLKL